MCLPKDRTGPFFEHAGRQVVYNEDNKDAGGEKMSYIELRDVRKIYHVGEVDIQALDRISFCVEKGELVIIAGASGAGKSTILNILGGMDTCTSGEIWLDGTRIDQYDEKQLTDYRRFDIGFVFQFYNLMMNLTALENVELACEISRDPMNAKEILDRVGLAERMDHFPAQLSGGEQQRVAIARALSKNPRLLLCDEPTGALDYRTGKQILRLLQEAARVYGMTVIIITHNLALCPMGDKVIQVKSGRVEKTAVNAHPADIDTIEW